MCAGILTHLTEKKSVKLSILETFFDSGWSVRAGECFILFFSIVFTKDWTFCIEALVT